MSRSSIPELVRVRRSRHVLAIVLTVCGSVSLSTSCWSQVKYPDVVDPGLGVGAVARSAPAVAHTEVVDPGRGVGAVVRAPITDPGTGQGAGETAIIDPCCGVGEDRRKGPAAVVDPLRGVGASERANAGVGQSGAGTSPYVQVIINPPHNDVSLDTSQSSSSGDVTRGGQDSRSANPASARGLIPRPSEFVAPMSYRDLDSGLRDCDIPFDELQAKSPFCRAGIYADGERCERFSFNQFPEVVKIFISFTDNTVGYCSGTMVASDWALTAAHCFLGNSSATQAGSKDHHDVLWNASSPDQDFVAAVVEASNAKMLLLSQRQISAERVIINGDAGGRESDPPFLNDIALVKLVRPFPAQAIQPAVLASSKQFSSMTTIAGYGYTNAAGGAFGRFELTWPVPVTQARGQMNFSPEGPGPVHSAFCQGDSGGPVFAGRYRGCKSADLAPEPRPRLLEGTISFNKLGLPDPTGSDSPPTLNQTRSSECRNASDMAMQDITIDARRKWICRASGNAAGGCVENSK